VASSKAAAVRRVTRLEWVVLILLVGSVAINYIDRGTLSIAGVALSNELHLKPHELGFLLSAFFWTYAGFQIVAGWLIDRFNVIAVLAVGFLIWSVATALTGVVTGFVALFVLRLLLGISESVSYPSYSKIIVASFPEEQRGFANGLIDVGGKLGPAIGLVAGGLILDGFGWRAVFISLGLASLGWLIPWLLVAPKMRAVVSIPALGPGATLADILKKREAWGTFLGLFCSNYAWYFMLTWLPQYLLLERHYSTRMMALTGWLPFCANATGAVLGGWLADAWIRRGASAYAGAQDFLRYWTMRFSSTAAAIRGRGRSGDSDVPADSGFFCFRSLHGQSLCRNANFGGSCGGWQVDRNPERGWQSGGYCGAGSNGIHRRTYG
jgi:ACS family D-galactonate transporter-like MFS transporter